MNDRRYSLYLAGPMTGIDGFNYPAFNAAAKRLRADPRVAFVCSPAELDDGDRTRAYPYYIKRDALALMGIPGRYQPNYSASPPPAEQLTRAIAVLPGWTGSPGALSEVALAKALGYAVLHADTLRPLDVEFAVRTTIRKPRNEEAKRAANGHPAGGTKCPDLPDW